MFIEMCDRRSSGTGTEGSVHREGCIGTLKCNSEEVEYMQSEGYRHLLVIGKGTESE